MGILGALGSLPDGVGTVLLEGKLRQGGGCRVRCLESPGEQRGLVLLRIFFTITMSMPELFPGGPRQQGWHVRKISGV